VDAGEIMNNILNIMKNIHAGRNVERAIGKTNQSFHVSDPPVRVMMTRTRMGVSKFRIGLWAVHPDTPGLTRDIMDRKPEDWPGH
jgi:hypothetical protein